MSALDVVWTLALARTAAVCPTTWAPTAKTATETAAMAYNVSLCLAASPPAPASAWATRLVTTMSPAAQTSTQTRSASLMVTVATSRSVAAV
ncbi:hypothetical protein V8C86DRAFT_2795470 [Haematococcus lacustris]